MMQLKEGIQNRKSIRGYLDKPVSQETIQDVLKLATRAVSALNQQPWGITVVTGEPLDKIRKINMDDLEKRVPFDVPEPQYEGEYRNRRVAVAKQLFQAMDIKREDKERRNWWLARGFRFFDAPVMLLLTADIVIDPAVSHLDIGCLVQNICLAAMEFGLGTCVQTQTVMLQRGLREVLQLPENRRPVVGIAMGYPDPEFPANHVVSTREELDKITNWIGF